MEVMVVVLVYYCCVTNYHKCNNFKQHKFITHSSMGRKSGVAQMGLLLSQAETKVLAGLGFFSGASREESVFNLSQVLAKFSFLCLKDRGPLLSCPLLGGGLSQLKAAEFHLLVWVTLSSSSQQL